MEAIELANHPIGKRRNVLEAAEHGKEHQQDDVAHRGRFSPIVHASSVTFPTRREYTTKGRFAVK